MTTSMYKYCRMYSLILVLLVPLTMRILGHVNYIMMCMIPCMDQHSLICTASTTHQPSEHVAIVSRNFAEGRMSHCESVRDVYGQTVKLMLCNGYLQNNMPNICNTRYSAHEE